MHQSLSYQNNNNKPSISMIVQEQQRHSIQQMERIQQSNKKLNLLQEKMKSLLIEKRDNKKKNINYDTRNNTKQQYYQRQLQYQQIQQQKQKQKHKQINRYQSSSKKYHHNLPQHTYHQISQNINYPNRRQSLPSDDDMLLENNNINDYSNNTDRVLIVDRNNNNNNYKNNRQHNKPNTSSLTSLKIFNNKKSNNKNKDLNKGQNNLLILDGNNNDIINKKSVIINDKNVVLDNFNKQPITQQQQQQNNNNHHYSHHIYQHQQQHQQQPPILIPNTDAFQINQLQLMMQKSIEIKQKQLLLAQQEVKKLQTIKLEEYRKNMQLQVQLKKIKQFKQQINVNNPIVAVMKMNGKSSAESRSLKQMQSKYDPQLIKQIIQQKQLLDEQNQKLLKQLKKLEEQQYNLKLNKKKVNFQFNSMERYFTRILKTKAKSNNKMKQNIQQNYQKYDGDRERERDDNNNKVNGQFKEEDRLKLGRKNHSVKTFRTNKKHSVSNFQQNNKVSNGQTDRERGEKMTINKKTRSKIDLSKSKEKFVTPVHDNNTHTKQHRVSKSTSCSVINRNRHTLAECQHNNKNCETDKILFEMVHQLDKLKQIVNKQIVKTKAKKGQRRVIEIYDPRAQSRRQKIALMR